MEKVIVFEINSEVSEKIEEIILRLLNEWLIETHKLDVLISSLSLAKMWSLSIDCTYISSEADINNVQKLTEQLLRKLEIPYKIATNS